MDSSGFNNIVSSLELIFLNNNELPARFRDRLLGVGADVVSWLCTWWKWLVGVGVGAGAVGAGCWC